MKKLAMAILLCSTAAMAQSPAPYTNPPSNQTYTGTPGNQGPPPVDYGTSYYSQSPGAYRPDVEIAPYDKNTCRTIGRVNGVDLWVGACGPEKGVDTRNNPNSPK